jgi:CHAD domain-containing protein
MAKITATPDRLGEFAHTLIQKHFRSVINQIEPVLADRDPEPLHQMRVGLRHLRATLQLLEPAVAIPQRGEVKALRQLGRFLGGVRNLDVIQQTIQQDYYADRPPDQQAQLDRVLELCRHDRQHAFSLVKTQLKHPAFEPTYRHWLKHPHYGELGDRPSDLVLPQLLNRTIVPLLLHPGWTIAPSAPLASPDQLALPAVLHDLRKLGKQARYQLEDCKSRFNGDLIAWIAELKQIQTCLGRIQDLQVLHQFLQAKVPELTHFDAHGDRQIQSHQIAARQSWNELRQPYLDPEQRHHCYQLICRLKSTE